MLCIFILIIAPVQAEYFERRGQEFGNITDIVIPNNTTECEIHRTDIEVIPANYFKDFPRLEILRLWFNEINEIQPFAFYQIPSIRRLYLVANKLEILRKNMFAGLWNLTSLRIASNLITTIESYTFSNLTSLRDVYLPHNKLKMINMEIFEPKIYELTWYKLQVRFYGNPVLCNRCLCWMMSSEDWLALPEPENIICSEPKQLAGRSWNSLCEAELGCLTIGKYMKYTKTIKFIFAISDIAEWPTPFLTYLGS